MSKTSITFRTPLAIPVKSTGDRLGYDILEVSVHYSKGGMNYFSGNQIPRGISVVLKPVRVSNGIVSCVLLGVGMLERGFKVQVKELSRFSPKQLQAIADQIEPIVPQLGQLYSNRDLAGADKLITDTLGLPSWQERSKAKAV